MLDIRPLDPKVAVAPQIAPADIAMIRAAGYGMVVNNRPDGETADQAEGEAIRAACAAAGMDYVAIPVTPAGFTHDQVLATIDALTTAAGPVLAYCRSGTRSCNLWALARAGMGDDLDDLTARAATAGYDLMPLRPLLEAVSHGG